MYQQPPKILKIKDKKTWKDAIDEYLHIQMYQNRTKLRPRHSLHQSDNQNLKHLQITI